jgi:hypothetical protein
MDAKMTMQARAHKIMAEQGARPAAEYLKRRGYSLTAALHILLRTEERYKREAK